MSQDMHAIRTNSMCNSAGHYTHLGEDSQPCRRQMQQCKTGKIQTIKCGVLQISGLPMALHYKDALQQGKQRLLK